jgi:hypothetical protein
MRLSIRVSPVRLSSGVAIGVGSSAIFVVLLGGIAIHSAFPRLTVAEWALALVITALATLGGLVFALLVARVRREPIDYARTLTLAALLPLAGAGGLVFAAQFEHLGTSRADLTLPVFRAAFVSASFLVALVCTLIAGGLYAVPGTVRQALQAAFVTATTYLLCAIVLDLIPGFHVGGGNLAMPKVAALSNLLAGIVGGYFAFNVLVHRSDHVTSCEHAERKSDLGIVIASR